MSSSALSAYQVERTQLPRVLELVLAEPGGGTPAGPAAVRSFSRCLDESSSRWDAFLVPGSSGAAAAALVLLPPGRTMLVMVPAPGELGIDREAQLELVRRILSHYASERLHFAQALVPPEAVELSRLLQVAGFGWLAPLVYLQRELRRPDARGVTLPSGAEWVTFSPQSYREFAATILATYQDSQDCPELTGLRPIEDIIAGHQAAGRFEPALWQLLRLDGQAAGCVLLSPLFDGQSVELVYMGVCPEFRRQGIGSALLARAVEVCCRRGAKRLTLAVDDRNEAAKRMYARFEFVPVARRDAYLYRWCEVSANSSPGS